MTVAFDSDTDITVEIAFGNGPGDATPTWTDVSAYCRGFGLRRGRNRISDRVAAATGNLALDNADRRFDPLYTSSPYNPDVKPLCPVRVSAVHNSITYRLFTGFVESWSQTWPANGFDSVAAARIVDGFSVLARSEVVTSMVEEGTDVRLGNILDDAGWPAGATWRDLDAGALDMVAVDLDCNNALLECHRIADSEGGLFFISGDGKATYQAAAHRAGVSSSGTIGDGPSGQSIRYYSIDRLEYDDTHLVNRIEVNRWGAAATVASEDATSVAAYGVRLKTYNDTMTIDDADTATLAALYRDRFKDPGVRFQGVQIRPQRSPAAEWPIALGTEISDKYTIVRTPPGGGTISQAVHVEGIAHRVDPVARTWDTRFDTSNEV